MRQPRYKHILPPVKHNQPRPTLFGDPPPEQPAQAPEPEPRLVTPALRAKVVAMYRPTVMRRLWGYPVEVRNADPPPAKTPKPDPKGGA
jgi:hypothetical protein